MKLALLLLLLAPISALACGGVAGTGKVADGTKQTRTAEQAKNTYIAADGYWTLCSATPKPVFQDCAGDQKFRTWSSGDNTCTTENRYASDATNPARDQGIRHGQVAMWRQWQGPLRGTLIERCIDGQRKVIASICDPVAFCDVKITINSRGKNYTYDARANRVPVGATVTALSADGSKMPLRCVAGDFVR